MPESIIRIGWWLWRLDWLMNGDPLNEWPLWWRHSDLFFMTPSVMAINDIPELGMHRYSYSYSTWAILRPSIFRYPIAYAWFRWVIKEHRIFRWDVHLLVNRWQVWGASNIFQNWSDLSFLKLKNKLTLECMLQRPRWNSKAISSSRWNAIAATRSVNKTREAPNWWRQKV